VDGRLCNIRDFFAELCGGIIAFDPRMQVLVESARFYGAKEPFHEEDLEGAKDGKILDEEGRQFGRRRGWREMRVESMARGFL
jgi:hypothetical protein